MTENSPLEFNQKQSDEIPKPQISAEVLKSQTKIDDKVLPKEAFIEMDHILNSKENEKKQLYMILFFKQMADSKNAFSYEVDKLIIKFFPDILNKYNDPQSEKLYSNLSAILKSSKSELLPNLKVNANEKQLTEVRQILDQVHASNEQEQPSLDLQNPEEQSIAINNFFTNPKIFKEEHSKIYDELIDLISKMKSHLLKNNYYVLLPEKEELFFKYLELDAKEGRLSLDANLYLQDYSPEFKAKFFSILKENNQEIQFNNVKLINFLLKNTEIPLADNLSNIEKQCKLSQDEKHILRRYLYFNNINCPKNPLEIIKKYQELKNFSAQKNENLLKENQSENVEQFFAKNQESVAKIIFLDEKLSLKSMKDSVERFGFPKLEKLLDSVKPLDANNLLLLKNILAKISDKNITDLRRIIELHSSLTSNRSEGLNEDILGRLLNKTTLLNSEVLKFYGRSLSEIIFNVADIKFSSSDKEAIVAANFLKTDTTKFIDELIFTIKKLKKIKPNLSVIPSGYGQLKNLISFSGNEIDLNEFLLNPNPDVVGFDKSALTDLIINSQETKKHFIENNIDLDYWLKYPNELNINTGAFNEQGFKNKLIQTYIELFEKLKSIPDNNLKNTLTGPKNAIKFNKIFRDIIFKLDHESIEKLFSEMPEELIINHAKTLITDFADLDKKAFNLEYSHLQGLVGDEKNSPKGSFSLTLSLWARNPAHDLFQGNFTHCCVGMGEPEAAAMVDYLTDPSINIIELIDNATQETVGNIFCYLAKTESGEIAFIIDNVELNRNYLGVNKDIRDKIFEYVTKFAINISTNKNKIDEIYLGRNFNDIPSDDLKTEKVKIQKIGGNGIFGKQYLDSWGSDYYDTTQMHECELAVAVEGLSKTEVPYHKNNAPTTPEIATPDIDPNVLYEIEKSLFGEHAIPLEDFKEFLGNEKAIQIIMKKNNQISGYLLTLPLPDSFEELSHGDPELKNRDDVLYIETIALTPETRSFETFKAAVELLKIKAKQKGYKKLGMHTRVKNGLSRAARMYFNAKTIRKFDKWLFTGEPAEYLEIDLNEENK